MEQINIAAFLAINGSAQSPIVLVQFALILANYSVLAIALWLILAWVRGTALRRRHLIEATTAALFGLGYVQLITLIYRHPRPFQLGLGQQLMPHLPDASFPSDHGTLFFALAFSFFLHPETRRIGAAVAALGCGVAWARVFLGVHFPFDMLGSAVLAGAMAKAVAALPQRWRVGVTLGLSAIYHKLLDVLHLPAALFPRP